jgi:hypothetical protein
MSVVEAHDTNTEVRCSIGVRFLEAFVDRDYERLAATLSSRVHFRALLPPGPREEDGAAAVVDFFRSLFGSAKDFEVVDVTLGTVAHRLHLSWHLRLRPAPFDIGEGWHTVEQQAFATPDASGTIEALDLLCSGMLAES